MKVLLKSLLFTILMANNGCTATPLTWKQATPIAVGVCGGLDKVQTINVALHRYSDKVYVKCTNGMTYYGK